MFKNRGWLGILALLLLALTACARSVDETTAFGGAARQVQPQMAVGDSAPAAAPMAPGIGAGGTIWGLTGFGGTMYGAVFSEPDEMHWELLTTEQSQRQRQVIRRATIEMGSNQFDDTLTALRQVAPALEGYIESEVLTAMPTPRLTIVMRVPVATFDTALPKIEALGEVHFQNQWAEDVTDRFYDMAGNLETRRIEEERVLALIEQAGDIHELLSLEARLSNVRQIIESYLSQLTYMAGQIAYSTITVMLVCTAQAPRAAGPTLGERIGGAFGDSVDGTVRAVQGVVVFAAGAVIPVGLLALVVGIAWMLIRRKRRGSIQI